MIPIPPNTGGNSGEFWLPWLVVMTLVVSATVGGPRVDTRGRPPAAGQGLATAVGPMREIPARMWQDPLEASRVSSVTPGKSDESSAEVPIEEVVSSCSREDPGEKGDFKESHRIHLLFVPIPSQNYPELVENRIRIRVAVTSALSSAGYSPNDPSKLEMVRASLKRENPWKNARDTIVEHMDVYFPGFSRLVMSTTLASIGNDGAAFKVVKLPLDRFKFDSNSNVLYSGDFTKFARSADRVLVFYVPEGDIPSEHQFEWIMALQRLLSDVVPDFRRSKEWVKATWLGPGSSDRFVDLLKDALQPRGDPGNIRNPIPFSIRAVAPTVADGFLPKLTGCPSVCQNRDSQGVIRIPLRPLVPNGPSISIFRGPCDDADFCESLVDELKLRRPELFGKWGEKPGGSTTRNKVVLLSEWDTLYGRALPKSFEIAFVGKGGSLDSIFPYTYLRGLDGQISGMVEKPAAKAEKAAELPDMVKDLMKSRAPLMAYGRTQVDYVNRLAKRLRRDVECDPDTGRISAIGILGSDTYDKLLILQVLRAEFPGAQVFTTELDAVLADPDQYSITRNLLIASGFGLGLSDDYQKHIMPFRDARQTAFYHATLEAVRFSSAGKNEERIPASPDRWKPLVYEVGRNGPCLLSDGGRGTTEAEHRVAWDRPPLRAGLCLNWMLPLVSLLVLGICMTTRFGRRPMLAALATLRWHGRAWRRAAKGIGGRRSWKRVFFRLQNEGAAWIFLVAVVFFLAVTIVIPLVASLPDQEPLFLSEGISSWPATWLRALGVFLAGAYFWNLSTGFRSALFSMRRMFREVFGPKGTSRVLSGPKNFARGFRLRSMGIGTRFFILGVFLVYMLLAFCLFGFLGGPAPTSRGAASMFVEKFTLLTAVCASNLLICYAIVHNLSCAMFLRRLAEWFRSKPDWEKEAPLNPTLIMQSVNLLSEVMGRMVYYPFTLVFVMIVARQSLFDNFDWPVSLVIVLFANSLILLVATLVMRNAAGSVRDAAVDSLQGEISAIKEPKLEGETQERDKIRLARAEWHMANIEKLQGAVFAQGITTNPVFRALLIPIGGTGIIQAIDLMSKMI